MRTRVCAYHALRVMTRIVTCDVLVLCACVLVSGSGSGVFLCLCVCLCVCGCLDSACGLGTRCRRSLEASGGGGDSAAAALVDSFDRRSDEGLVAAWLMLQRYLGRRSQSYAYIQVRVALQRQSLPVPRVCTVASL